MENNFKFHLGPEAKHHEELISFLKNSKINNVNFKVLDVGGACCGRFWELTDFILDWKTPFCGVNPDHNPYTKFRTKHLKGNILRPEGWQETLDYVKENGKFDFVLCTHTIEDLPDPSLVIEMLQKVAKAGYISVPSKDSEIRKGYHLSFPNFMGCAHHFWIYLNYKGKLIGMPKMNWIEWFSPKDLYNIEPHLGGSGAYNVPYPKQELNLYWKDQINFCMLIPVDVNSLPDFIQSDHPEIYEIYKQEIDPWGVWKYLLNNAE
jgi:hypothetical protein